MDRVSPHRFAASTNGSQLQGDDAIKASQDWARAAFSAARGAIEIRLDTTHPLACFASANRAVFGANWCAVSALCCAHA
jgi:hypothetical protein